MEQFQLNYFRAARKPAN